MDEEVTMALVQSTSWLWPGATGAFVSSTDQGEGEGEERESFLGREELVLGSVRRRSQRCPRSVSGRAALG